MDTNEKMLGVETSRRDIDNFDMEKFEEIKRVEADIEMAEDMDMSHDMHDGCGCSCNCKHDGNMEIAEDMDMNENMEVAEDMDMNHHGCGGCCGKCGFNHGEAMGAMAHAELAEDSYYRNMDRAFELAGDADFGESKLAQSNIMTANGINNGMSPSEISEQMSIDRETYEEFSEDFDESNPQESGYAGITDEANADSLELAADEYFDEDRGYTSTAEYTMISDEDMAGS